MRLFLYGNVSCGVHEKERKRQVPCKVILYLLFNNSNRIFFSFLLTLAVCALHSLPCVLSSLKRVDLRWLCTFRFCFLFNVYDEIKTVEKSSDHKSIPQRNITATLHNYNSHSSSLPCHYPLASFLFSLKKNKKKWNLRTYYTCDVHF